MKSKKISGSHVCKSCHSVVVPKKEMSGTFWMELLLWLLSFALLPLTYGVSLLIGLGYSLSRYRNNKLICPVCGSDDVVPVDSPIGRKILKEEGLVEA